MEQMRIIPRDTRLHCAVPSLARQNILRAEPVMTTTNDLEARVAALEARVAELQATVATLCTLVTDKPTSSGPTLRSLGMLDRPKTGR